MPAGENGDGRGGLGTVRNAVTLLELLAEGPVHQQLTEIAERSGMSMPTVHRLLRSLTLADIVEQAPRSGRYGLGPELVRLSQRYLARLPILGALAPFLSQLRDSLGTTIEVQILVHSSVVTIDRVDGPDVGLYREPHATFHPFECAGGRALVAHCDEQTWLDAAALATPATLATARAERAQWAASAYVVCDGPELGAPAQLAAPLIDAHGSALAALVSSLPRSAGETETATVGAQLVRAGTAAVRTLGHA